MGTAPYAIDLSLKSGVISKTFSIASLLMILKRVLDSHNRCFTMFFGLLIFDDKIPEGMFSIWGVSQRWSVGSLVQKDLIVLQLLQQHLSVVGDVDSLELFRRIIAMFKVHVFNDLVRADDLNDLESMVFFLFTFKYSSSIVDSLSVNFSKIFSDPILVKVVSHWSFSLQQHIILLPFSESDTVIPDLVFIIV